MSPRPKNPLGAPIQHGPATNVTQECRNEKDLQISLLPRTTAVTLTRRQIPQTGFPALDLLLIALQDLQRLRLGPSNLGLLPTTRPPAIPMLHQQMCRSDFPVFGRARSGRVGGGTVVKGHVGFYLVRVRARGGFPAGFFGGGVEVVGEVFGVGVADFPLGGETGVGGGL